MFTPDERSRLREHLLDRAAADPRITSAAITGSAAAEREDRWSDIDLAFGLTAAAEMPLVLADWTTHMYSRQGAIHHLDIVAGPWIYRVFLLPGTLQVDLALVPSSEFRGLAPTFRLIFGEAQPPQHFPAPQPESMIGMGWLYALHARTSIARGQVWQAEFMISGARDTALAMACLRHGLIAIHAKGIDQLPADVKAAFAPSIPGSLALDELSRAFSVVLQQLFKEIRFVDAELASRLQDTLTSLAETVQ